MHSSPYVLLKSTAASEHHHELDSTNKLYMLHLAIITMLTFLASMLMSQPTNFYLYINSAGARDTLLHRCDAPEQ